MKRALAIVALWGALPAALALNQEFNWIPSGVIAVGERGSEALAKYEAVGARETIQVGYRGEDASARVGRRVTGPETFVIRPGSWRLGPAWAHLVICKTVDSSAVPAELSVQVNGQDLAAWTVVVPDGPRRLVDVYYVIPRTLFPEGRPPAEVQVKLASGASHLSLGYRFYADQTWDALGDDLAGAVHPTTRHVDAAVLEAAPGGAAAYLQGLAAFGDHDWARAERHAADAAVAAGQKDDARHRKLARMARVLERWAKLRRHGADVRAAHVQVTLGDEAAFERYRALGLLAGAWGFWEDALAAYRQALVANPTDADTTYRLAEAMEYCRMPIDDWAPLMERAGMLGETADCNVEHVLVAIHVPAQEGICPALSAADLEAIQRDWQRVEQQVYGASLGAWKLQTHYTFRTVDDPEWVMQATWIFLPDDDFADYEGQYQYSVGTAGFGWSHAGGSDCGVAGAGGANVGARRNWEVFLHEWNHEFDWIFLFAESGPGYPVTHDSDGCGKQPIVSMGCGHRSSMRYYVNRQQYKRHRGSDRVQSAAFVAGWQLGPRVDAPAPPGPIHGSVLGAWLVRNEVITPETMEAWQRDWKNARAADEQRAADPPPLPARPPRKDTPEWPEYAEQRWAGVRMIQELKSGHEAKWIAGEGTPEELVGAITGKGDFVDLAAALPDAPRKCVQYVRTFIHSPKDQEVRLWFGWNDCAMAWLNQRPLTTGRYYAVAKWEDLNRPYMLAHPAHLQKGWNCLALKVERGGGDWGFAVHVVDFDNEPVAGLRFSPRPPMDGQVAVYAPPEVGPHYKWAEVKDDYLELLPKLDSAALVKLTGIRGLRCAPHRFLLMLPFGTQPLEGSRFIDQADDADMALNNYLNWDVEAAAALRYEKDGETRDLVVVRPEYFEEFLALLDERGAPATPATERLLGYLWLDEARYSSTPNRPFTARAAIVIDAQLGDYPADDVGLLDLP